MQVFFESFLLPGEKNTLSVCLEKNSDCSSKLVHARIHLFCLVLFYNAIIWQPDIFKIQKQNN